MANPREKVSSIDPIWTAMRQQAEAMAGREPTLAGFVHATILQHDRLEQALSYHLARKLGGEDLSPLAIREMFDDLVVADAGFGQAVRADLSDPKVQMNPSLMGQILLNLAVNARDAMAGGGEAGRHGQDQEDHPQHGLDAAPLHPQAAEHLGQRGAPDGP